MLKNGNEVKIGFPEEINVDLIKKAYKALKTSIYYDKSNTNIILRKTLIEFEANNDLEYIFTNLYNRINKEDNDYFLELYNKIDLVILAKKFKKVDTETNFISNNTRFDRYEVERKTFFIDCPIELHLITILWIYTIGVHLDKKLSKSIYGNRLNYDYDKDELNTLSLFKPYYNQYSNWRDDAVKTARFITEEQKKDSAILTLDIKDYYYSIAISKKELKESLEVNIDCRKYKFKNLDQKVKYIQTIFDEIHRQYSSLLQKESYPEDNNISEIDLDAYFSLPIGLLSSFVLANWYLNKFDFIIEQKIKPAFYGRYVDDIIFVFKEPTMEAECYCCENENCIEHKYRGKISKVASFIANHLHEAIHIIPDENNKCKVNFENEHFELKLNPRNIHTNKKPSLIVQKEKVFLYYFDHKEPISVLDKLKRDIEIASSEFRFFNDSQPQTFDDKVFELQYDGVSRKIITLKDYKINNFGLSVYLSKKIYNLSYYKANDQVDFNKITTFFQGGNILDYSNHWEKLMTYLVLINKTKAIENFLGNAICEISKIKDTKDNKSNIIRHHLQLKLYWSLILPISLNPKLLSETMKSKFRKCYTFETNFEKDIKNTRLANMIRQNLITIPFFNFTEGYSQDTESNLLIRIWDFNDKYLQNMKLSNKLTEYTPRTFSNHEISLYKLIDCVQSETKEIDKYSDFIKSNKLSDKVKSFKIEQDTKKSNLFINKISYENEEDYNMKNSENLKIAVSNFYVNIENTKKRLIGKPNISISRYQKITKCIDIAEKEKADMIVFPEFAVPIEFVNMLANYVAQKQIAVIFGMEHIIYNQTAYNYCVTILPMRSKKFKDAKVFYRLKNHYAPSERKMIEGYGLKVPRFDSEDFRYDIFNFRGTYFSVFYCFELADINHRALLKSKVDFVVCSEWNIDVNYFSNIVESASRDLHCYFVQCNTRQFGDSRITAPSETIKKDLMKIKGGENDVVLIGDLDIKGLREFQLKEHILQMEDKRFKLTPPDFDRKNVQKRFSDSDI